MRFSRTIALLIAGASALATAPLWADNGDVESSHDYTGFPRLPGFLISDYDEDDPATFDFPVSRPTAIDSNHIEKVHVKGHRYAIRFELAAGKPATPVYDTQKYYEKLATDAGFIIEKSGAVGDVTESYYKAVGSGSVWVFVEPDVSVNVITVVESPTLSEPPASMLIVKAPKKKEPEPVAIDPDADGPAIPVTLPDSPAPALPTEQSHDSIYASLTDDGRVIVPFTFQPGKDVLDASSQPLVERVVAMMKAHPELDLRIEGHTDNTGDPNQNMRLSAQRALAVQAKLVDGDINKKRLDAVGVGGLQPLADNETADGREKNRRIELVLWKKSPAFHQPAPSSQARISQPPPKKDADDDTVIETDPTFHAPAPNGNNYYPNSGSSNHAGL